jgi:hypothetical protein
MDGGKFDSARPLLDMTSFDRHPDNALNQSLDASFDSGTIINKLVANKTLHQLVKVECVGGNWQGR